MWREAQWLARSLARFPIRWNYLIEKNSRQFKNLGSMSLSEKRVHFSGTCSKALVAALIVGAVMTTNHAAQARGGGSFMEVDSATVDSAAASADSVSLARSGLRLGKAHSAFAD
jgi:hypothetical protein